MNGLVQRHYIAASNYQRFVTYCDDQGFHPTGLGRAQNFARMGTAFYIRRYHDIVGHRGGKLTFIGRISGNLWTDLITYARLHDIEVSLR